MNLRTVMCGNNMHNECGGVVQDQPNGPYQGATWPCPCDCHQQEVTDDNEGRDAL